jgi:hypothetical protein
MVIPIFHGRELSRRLGINLARWKRWSREFLPPDPLAGIQSGYARQYYLDDAFRVYLGGYLVSHLHLAMPDARQVLTDLTPWMKRAGLCFDLRGQLLGPAAAESRVQCYEIHLQAVAGGFFYRVRALMERRLLEPGPPALWAERWSESPLGTDPASGSAVEADAFCRTVRLSLLISRFQQLMENSNTP